MNKFKVKVEREENNKSFITIEPLDQGYGHTLGNSLRRVLLTTMQGAAISSVKVAGVSHQFATIPGVVEDVIQLVLSLKKVRVKIYGDRPIRMTLNKSGKGEVKAGDIDTLGTGEIVNPDLYLATLSDDKSKLSLEITAEPGTGYIPAEERKFSEIGVIAVDSIFTPIMSVNYTVEQTRVGRRTDFDRLNLEIETDGTITGLEAVEKSARILSGYFKQVYEPEAEEEVDEKPSSSFVSDDVMKASVEELDLPVRITNALKAIEIDTIGKLVTVSPTILMKAKNLGAKSLTMISEKLAERGLALGEA